MPSNTSTRDGLLANAFQKPFWNSRITSANVTKKELILGYVAGPFGAMLLQSIVNSYFNQYLTDVLGFTVCLDYYLLQPFLLCRLYHVVYGL